MATATTLPVARPALKPTRSMTHPLRDPKRNGGANCRAQKGEPLDPKDLTRRLQTHLARQRLQAERQRARDVTQKSEPYHHVPQVAASDFARTTTPDEMGHRDLSQRQVHKLAQHALKLHLVGEDAASKASPSALRQVQVRDLARAERAIINDRNQFQWSQELEEAARSDKYRALYKIPQRTFESSTSTHLNIIKIPQRPLSTGDVYWEGADFHAHDSTASHTHAHPKRVPVQVANDRHDWAQRDENQPYDKGWSIKDRIGPFLKKTESVWILKNKKDRTSKETEAESSDADSSPDANKHKKGNLLARFKR